jgi:hypothetical protein
MKAIIENNESVSLLVAHAKAKLAEKAALWRSCNRNNVGSLSKPAGSWPAGWPCHGVAKIWLISAAK